MAFTNFMWLFALVGSGFSLSPKEALGSKIVGGSTAWPGEFPYMAEIQYNGWFSRYDQHWCGGAILTRTFVVTAARCFDTYPWDNYYYVYAGDLKLSEKEVHEQYSTLKRIIKHPQYAKKTSENEYVNDIALVELEKEFCINQYWVDTIKLPNSGQIFTGEAIMTGWGQVGFDQGRPNMLQKATIPLWTDEKCKQDGVNIVETNICAGGVEIGACYGDNGGPLVQNNTLVGIFSWDVNCSVNGSPGVFTEVSHYLDWLNKYIK